MAGRFHFAPIDPGYGAFGATIAAGMGQGIANYQQGQAVQTEEERYAEAQRIAEEQRQRAAEQRRTELALRYGATPVDGPAGGGGVVSPIVGAFTPGNESGVARMPVAPMTVGGAMEAMPPEPTGDLLAPPLATGPARPASAAEPAVEFTEGGQRYRLDPSRSAPAREEAYEFRLNQQRGLEKRGEIQNVIARVLEDGKISPSEAVDLKTTYGIDASDLEDPEKAAEKAYNSWKKRFDDEQAGRERIARINAASRSDGSGPGGLTAGQAIAAAKQNVTGIVQRLHSEGLDPYQILEEVRAYGSDVGGEGVLQNIITDAVIGRQPITPNQAYSIARAMLEDEGVDPYDDGYTSRLQTLQQQIMNDERERENSRRKVWDRRGGGTDTPPPAARSGGPSLQGNYGTGFGSSIGNVLSGGAAASTNRQGVEVNPSYTTAFVDRTWGAALRNQDAEDIRETLFAKGVDDTVVAAAVAKYAKK